MKSSTTRAFSTYEISEDVDFSFDNRKIIVCGKKFVQIVNFTKVIEAESNGVLL